MSRPGPRPASAATPAALLRIAALSEADGARAAQLLARAFRDNPLNLGVIRSRSADRRRRVNAHGMRGLLPVALRRGLVRAAYLEQELVAVLIAARPYGYPLPPPPLASRLRTWAGQGWGVAQRWRRVFDALDARHPQQPHWYLGILGVDSERQRRGIGGRLLREWLAQVDADGGAAYLETDRRENVAFYARAGFEVVGELRVLEVPVWLMLRPRVGALQAARLSPPGEVGY